MDPHNTPVALEMAFLLGALHALEPGHGKTAIIAYMADGKKNLGHSIFLGIVSATSHTFSIMGFAFLAHLVSHIATGGHQNSAPLTMFFSCLSGLLMIGIGVFLLVKSKSNQHSQCCAEEKAIDRGQKQKFKTPNKSVRSPLNPESLKLLPISTNPQHHGSLKVSALLGVSGGLMPCPSALATYLSGLANGNTDEALLAILVFAVGIAVSVSMVGVVFRLAAEKFRSLKPMRLNLRSLSTGQALIILLVGLFYFSRAAYDFVYPKLTSSTLESDNHD